MDNTISNIILALLPIIGLGCMYLYKILAQKLPASMMAMLEQLVPYAVHNVEQTYVNTPSAEKKQLARDFIIKQFQLLGLPAPSEALIDSAIESTVLIMNNMPQIAVAKEDPNPLAITNEA